MPHLFRRHAPRSRPAGDTRLRASSHHSALKAACLALGTALLAGCSSSPPVQLYQLRSDPPDLRQADQPSAVVTGRWALGPVLLPDYLDRDAIVRPSGQATLGLLPGQRWAEPLRDAVPRLLLQDLVRLRGGDQVWRSPLPPGVKADRQLRVEIQRLDAPAGARQVILQARWMLIDPSGLNPAVVLDAQIQVPLADDSTDTLVSAHRAALWQLAQQMAAQSSR